MLQALPVISNAPSKQDFVLYITSNFIAPVIY